ncbi:TMEM165/GDT1 family protein, partial [Acinetobacter baumannii]
LGPEVLRWLIGLSFLAMAGWALIPDKLDQEGEESLLSRLSAWGPFVTTVVAFFLAEIGDKTQLATVALAARADSLIAVVVGTTVGMAL